MTTTATRNSESRAIDLAGSGDKPATVRAFVIGQVAGRPLYLVVGEDAEHRITPGLPFNDD